MNEKTNENALSLGFAADSPRRDYSGFTLPESFEPSRIDRGAYTLSLAGELLRSGAIERSEFERLSRDIYARLGAQIELYTGGESTSVESTAGSKLLASILYNTDLALLRLGGDEAASRRLLSARLEDIYYDGLLLNRELNLRARSLLRRLRTAKVSTPSLAYNRLIDRTLEELIRGYDEKFDAAARLTRVDYPTPTYTSGRRGIAGMSWLLTELIAESDFLRSFPEDELTALWKVCRAMLSERERVPVNLGRLVFAHAMLSLLATGEPTLPLSTEISSGSKLDRGSSGARNEKCPDMSAIRALAARLAERYPDRDSAYYAMLGRSHLLEPRGGGTASDKTREDAVRAYTERLSAIVIAELADAFGRGESALAGLIAELFGR